MKDWPIVEGREEEYKTRMRERISELIGRVRRLDGERNYVAKTTAQCFFCKFQTLCTRYPQGSPVFPVDEEPT